MAWLSAASTMAAPSVSYRASTTPAPVTSRTSGYSTQMASSLQSPNVTLPPSPSALASIAVLPASSET